MLAALHPKAVTAKGPKRQGNGAQGEKPCPKKPKGLPAGPTPRPPHALPVPAKATPAAAPSPPAPEANLPKGLTPPQSAAPLLATPRRQKPQQQVRQRKSLSRKQFTTLYRAPSERDPEPVRVFPASRRITMPTRAACSTAARKSSPMRSMRCRSYPSQCLILETFFGSGIYSGRMSKHTLKRKVLEREGENKGGKIKDGRMQGRKAGIKTGRPRQQRERPPPPRGGPSG